MTRTGLTIPQGVHWGIAWPITQDGEPLDLTGWTVKAQIRKNIESDTVLYEWSNAAGNVTVNDSQVTLLVSPATSTAWTWERGVYDVELTSPSAIVYRIAAGPVYVSPEVTR